MFPESGSGSQENGTKRRANSPIRTGRELGVVVRERRIAMQLNRPQLAQLVGLDPAVLRHLEHGNAPAGFEDVLLVLQALGLALDARVILQHAPSEREYAIFRLRVVEGRTLAELAHAFDLHRERVRQILNQHFRLAGLPSAARAARGARRSAARQVAG